MMKSSFFALFGFFIIHATIIGTTTRATGLSLDNNALRRSILVTGSNKGQGLALCERILSEHDDTHVFVCSRDVTRGETAQEQLSSQFGSHRVDLLAPFDVTDESSVQSACQQVKERLEKKKDELYLYGLVSNAGILWDHTLQELFDVCTVGPKNVLGAFLPLLHPEQGRVLVVSSGLGPLMNGFSSPERQTLLMKGSPWNVLHDMMEECLLAYNEQQSDKTATDNNDEEESELSKIGFGGGPFEVQVPDFHHYGLSKMFADAYMLTISKSNPNLHVYSCDPGLVYTDLIDKMPKYAGKPIEETGAKTPHQGVEVAMQLLFPNDAAPESGKFYAMKGTDLVGSAIDQRPDTKKS